MFLIGVVHIIALAITLRMLRTQTRLRICLYSSVCARLLGTTWIHVVEKAGNPVVFSIFPVLRTGVSLWGSGKCTYSRIRLGARQKRRNWGMAHLPVVRIKKYQIKTSKNTVLLLTGSSHFPILVVDPSEFSKDSKKLGKVGAFLVVGWSRLPRVDR